MINIHRIDDNYIITNADKELLKSYNARYQNQFKLFLMKADAKILEDQEILSQIKIYYHENNVTKIFEQKDLVAYFDFLPEDILLYLIPYLDHSLNNLFVTCKMFS